MAAHHPPRLPSPLVLSLVVSLLALAGCTPAEGEPPAPAISSSSVAASSSGGLPRPEHVLLVVFENKGADEVIGAPAAPYLTSLARAGANFTDAHGVTHPSQPNYLALFSGSTHGVTDNSCPQSLTGPNLAAQLIHAGRSFTGYSEDLPRSGATDCKAGDYRRKHNPWVNFAGLPVSVNQPFSALPSDYADLPTVAVVVPNMCNDMHDCSVATGDRWARTHLQPYLAWAQTHDSLLIVTFDEGHGADNTIPTVFAGPMVRAGDTGQRIDHYSVLRTLEEMYGLAPLGEAAHRQPIAGIWTAG